MKKTTILFLAILITVACTNGSTKNTTENEMKHSDSEQEWLKKLGGEWAIRNDWRDGTLTFINTKNENFKQEIFPSYNTIVFNQKDKTIEVNTYGEFGCGTAAIQDLKISNSS